MSEPVDEAPEEKKEKISSDASESSSQQPKGTITKAVLSLVGILLVGAIVVYGLPHLSDAIQGVIGKSQDVEGETKKEEVTSQPRDQIDGGKGTVSKQPIKPETGSDKPTMSRNVIQGKVKDALEKALKSSYRKSNDLFLERVKVTADSKEVTAIFKLDGELREMIFTYDQRYKEYVAKLDEEELKKYFSMRPSFVISTE